jgi:hypothetical protein
MAHSHLSRALIAWALTALLLTGLGPAAASSGATPLAQAGLNPIGKLSASVTAVAFKGDLAILGDPAGLLVVDIATPARPVLLSSLNLGGQIGDLAVSGDLAYVANYGGTNPGKLQIVDLSNPFAPRLRGSLELPGNPSGVDLAGSLAAVATFNGGLQLVDVDNPDVPAILGTVGPDVLRNSVLDVRLAAGRAYVANLGGLYIVDIANPASAALLDAFNSVTGGAIIGNGQGVDVAGDRAYLAAGGGGLLVLDVSDPTFPILVGTFDTPVYAQKVEVRGDRAYVADREGGLQLVDVSNPTAPAALDRLDTLGSANRLAVANDRVLVADMGGGMPIVSATGAGLERLGRFATPGNSTAMARGGDRVYVASFEGLAVVDISTPARPTVVGSLAFPGIAYSLAITGTTVYVGTDLRYESSNGFRDSAVWAVDLSDPAQLTVTARVTLTMAAVEGLTLVGSTLYAPTAGQGLRLFGVSDPSILAPLSTPTAMVQLFLGSLSLSLSGDRAYGQQGHVLDVSNPAVPALVGTLPLSNTVLFDVTGPTASTIESIWFQPPPGDPPGFDSITTTLKLYDLTNLEAPQLLGSYLTGAGATIDSAAAPYTLRVDAGTTLAASSRQGIAYWDGATWVDLPPCADCSVSTGQLAVQTNRFGELALVGDAPPPEEHPPGPGEPPFQAGQRLFLPLVNR